MKNTIEASIESLFRKTVQNDPKVTNAFLLVHSDTANVHINLAEGYTGDITADPQQPNYMASVGKLFTAAVVGQLHELKELSFDDKIGQYLDPELMNRIHIHKGIDYSSDIQIRHLLNQTSGLPDNFYPLMDKVLMDPEFNITPREAVEWAKQHLKPSAPPGKKAYYTDTNYHLLGLIVENVRGEPFHEVLRNLIFEPLDMKHSSMLHCSEPIAPTGLPIADFFIKKTRINDMKGFAGIDYTGGGVVAPMEDLLIFIKALVSHKLVSHQTLDTMLSDKSRMYPNFDYGYAIWQLIPIPLLIPRKYRSWGVLGATGAWLFYHPQLDTYVMGNFNQTAWQRKCVRFMLKIFNIMWKRT